MSETFDVQSLRIDRSARRTRRRRRRWGAPLVLALALAGAGWLFQRQILALVDRFRLPEVETAPVVVRSAGSVAGAAGVSANGYVIARTRAALSADTPGRIVEMNVAEGSVVARGDVVARLYADEYQAALQQAEADLESTDAARERAATQVEEARVALVALRAAVQGAVARVAESEAERVFAALDHARTTKLVNDGIERQQVLDQAQWTLDASSARVTSSQAELERARAELERGQATLRVAEASLAETRSRVPVAVAARDLAAATLEKTLIRAPFDGIVTQKEAEVGEVVSPNSQGGSLARGSVVTMVDMDSLEVQADVPETTLAKVREGGPARIYLDAFPDHVYPGRVDRIWPTADRQKATVEVRVVFLERDERLRPEMGVRIVFLDEEPEEAMARTSAPVVLVPGAALAQRGGLEGVFLLEGETVRFRELGLGGSEGARRIVSSGLSGGELVVLEPPRDLREGDRVRASRPN